MVVDFPVKILTEIDVLTAPIILHAQVFLDQAELTILGVLQSTWRG